jgi:sulfate/thiosulfate transport system ATP-binding protein
MHISIRNLTKRFESTQALDNISLEIPDGQLVALLGPSGCGKTTLLRIMAGLEMPDQGEVHFGDRDAATMGVRERQVGFVFQHYALFRHMSVRDNIGYSLSIQKRPKPEIRMRVDELLDLIQLQGVAERLPHQLSGGQRQRVALARALAAKPEFLLLDEPFGALDAQVRQDLRRWLRKLHDDMHVTSVFVTHDQEEAFEVSDRVVIMNKGRVEQVGTPEEIFHQPANAFVMHFLGNVNIFHSRLEGEPGHFELVGPGGLPANPVFVRPHDLVLTRETQAEASVPGRITHVRTIGLSVRVSLTTSRGQDVQVELAREEFEQLGLGKGDTAYATPKRMQVFSNDYTI